MYRVNPPDKERWIFIFSDDPDEPDEFVALVKAYSNMVHGKITEVSELMQYKIDNDELGLIFQWDDCFGITVIVPGLKNKLCKCNNNQNFDNAKITAKQGNAEERPDAGCGIKR